MAETPKQCILTSNRSTIIRYYMCLPKTKRDYNFGNYTTLLQACSKLRFSYQNEVSITVSS